MRRHVITVDINRHSSAVGPGDRMITQTWIGQSARSASRLGSYRLAWISQRSTRTSWIFRRRPLLQPQRTTNIDPNTVIRPVVPTDAEALAQLMLEAYRGTIDYEGEEIEEARDAIDEFFSGAPLLSASMTASVDGAAASAVLVISLDAGPFISYVVTHPVHKRSGLAAQVVTAACRQLAESGENKVSFAITDGNVASEALFSRLGAVRLQS